MEDSRFFRDLHRRHGIFQRQSITSSELRLPALPLALPAPPVLLPTMPLEPQRPGGYEKIYVQLMERYGPPSLVVDANYNIIYFAEDISRYLHHHAGSRLTTSCAVSTKTCGSS